MAFVILGPLSNRILVDSNFGTATLTERCLREEICTGNLMRWTNRILNPLTMGDMFMTDVVEEESSHPSKQRPFNGSECTTDNRPLRLSIMWYSRIGEVKISEHADPSQVYL